jgi:hypothetical protein
VGNILEEKDYLLKGSLQRPGKLRIINSLTMYIGTGHSDMAKGERDVGMVSENF